MDKFCGFQFPHQSRQFTFSPLPWVALTVLARVLFNPQLLPFTTDLHNELTKIGTKFIIGKKKDISSSCQYYIYHFHQFSFCTFISPVLSSSLLINISKSQTYFVSNNFAAPPPLHSHFLLKYKAVLLHFNKYNSILWVDHKRTFHILVIKVVKKDGDTKNLYRK